MIKGKYIVIEGAEGVGKTTMVQRVASALQQAGLPVRVMREPDSQNDLTARTIRHLTQDPRYPMNTRTEVLLYNAARSQSLEVIRQTVETGVTCLVDRSYLTTLAIQYYGRGDIQDYVKINEIIDFAVGDMQPDLMLVLDAPVDVLKERTKDRYSGDRFDNLDEAFLERVRAGYLWEARQRNLAVVYATGDVEDVFNQVWKHVAATLAQRGDKKPAEKPVSVAEVIAEKQAAQTTTPATTAAAPTVSSEKPTDSSAKASLEKIPASLRKDYERALAAIMDIRGNIEKELLGYAKANPDSATTEQTINAALETLSLQRIAAPAPHASFSKAASEVLPRGYANSTQPVTLTNYTPRNELDVVADMLYEQGDISKRTAVSLAGDLDYTKRNILFDAYMQSSGAALGSVQYEFDFLTSGAVYDELSRLDSFKDVMVQAPTPRHGYETPEIIEAAGLAETYATCFDISLQLYSILQQVGDGALAPNATLMGHRLRWKGYLAADKLHMLAASAKDATSATHAVIRAIIEAVGEVHPLTTAALLSRKS